MRNTDYSSAEIRLFKKLSSPRRVQDFLNEIAHNPAKGARECNSPRVVLKTGKAHCMEGALFAAAVLEFYGQKPLVLDLRSTRPDVDHVIAPFRQFGCWGALSKTNHAVLRYREPVYRSVRELVMSYFHEYFLDSGLKTLRQYSQPFNLQWFDRFGRLTDEHGTVIADWRTASEDLYKIPKYLDRLKHRQIVSAAQVKNLRLADAVEIRAGKITSRH